MSLQSSDQHKPFIPRESEFWLYNSVGWFGALFLFFSITFLEIEDLHAPFTTMVMYTFLGSVLTYVGGTFAGLIFRRWYHRNHWWQSTFQMVLRRAILLSLICAFLFNAIANLTYDVISGIPAEFFSSNGELRATAYFFRYAYPNGNGALAFMLVMLWCLIYLGIKGPQYSRSFSLKALELESSLKEAQLDALSAQIQPHFLFNALNNIRFMIKGNADRAEASLISLSEILRHSLDSGQNEKVELGKELMITKQYLDLMENQMGNRLSYTIDVAPALETALMPPMVIQMLAENAIKHGIDRNKEGGSICIEGSEQEGQLIIKVRNTMAPPLPPSKATDIIRASQRDKGVGLANIEKRLSLLYGTSAQLTLSKEDGQALVRIELPKELAA